MSGRQRTIASISIMLVAILSTITVFLVRHKISEDNVTEYKRQVETIKNYPDPDNTPADKALLIEAIEYDSKNFEAPLLLAQTLHNSREYDKALIFYQKAISASPDSASGYWYRSQCYAALKKYDRAIADMTKCIKLEPGNYSDYFARARLYSSIGDRVAAIKDYDEIINREDYDRPKYKSFSAVLNNKAYALMGLGDYYKALPLLNQAIKLEQDDTYYGSRGELYYAVGDYDKSYNDFSRAIKMLEANKGKSTGDNPSSYYYYRGMLHYRRGILEGAKEDLQRAVDMGSVEAAEPLHKVEQTIGKSLIENI